jgi:hypothetical protein
MDVFAACLLVWILGSCSFAVDNKCGRTPTGKDEAAARYWSAESHGQGIRVSSDKEILQANNSAASVPIPTIPKSQGCDIGQEPNYGFLNR